MRWLPTSRRQHRNSSEPIAGPVSSISTTQGSGSEVMTLSQCVRPPIESLANRDLGSTFFFQELVQVIKFDSDFIKQSLRFGGK